MKSSVYRALLRVFERWIAGNLISNTVDRTTIGTRISYQCEQGLRGRASKWLAFGQARYKRTRNNEDSIPAEA